MDIEPDNENPSSNQKFKQRKNGDPEQHSKQSLNPFEELNSSDSKRNNIRKIYLGSGARALSSDN